jgi:HlyD family secretion protein
VCDCATQLFLSAAGECYTQLVTEGLPGATAERLQIPDVHRRGRSQRWLFAGVLVAALAGGLFWYRSRTEPVSEVYRTVRVVRRDVQRAVEATGHVDARARFEVPAAFAGRLTEVLVRTGDRVQRGQPLARLDDRAGGFAVRNASASKDAASWHMNEAQGALDSASEDKTRIERLAARGLASTQDVAAAHSALTRAAAALEAARAERSVADSQLASARYTHTLGEIVAPIDGVVLVAPENLGAAVTPEHALFVVAAPLELMRVDVDVGEADIGEVRPDQHASFQVQSFPERTFSARVERVGVEPRRDNGVVTYPVRLLADNPDGALLPGMTASVQLEVARVSNVLAVREAALRFMPPGAAAAPARSRLFRRVGPGQLEPLAVKAGLSDGSYAQVQAAGEPALAEGDEIAVGVLNPEAAARNQPGISLGNK